MSQCNALESAVPPSCWEGPPWNKWGHIHYSYLHWIRAQVIADFFINIAEHQRGCHFKGLLITFRTVHAFHSDRLLSLVASPSATPAALVSTFLMATRGSKKAPLLECSTVNGWQFWKAETQGKKKRQKAEKDWAVGPRAPLGHLTGWSAALATSEPQSTHSPKGRGVASGPREAAYPGLLQLLRCLLYQPR